MTHDEFDNRLLASLPGPELDDLRPHLESVDLATGQILANSAEALEHLYLIQSGIVSLVMTTREGASIEVAIAGREGLAGAFALLGRSTMPFSLVAQGPGRAVRVDIGAVRERLDRCGHLHRIVLAYIQTLIGQISQAVVCNRFHSARQRLSRWLLLTTDLLATDTLPLTQEWIAQMVGGPRSAVSEVIGELRDAGLIEYRRGVLQILDRAALERESCECYTIITARLARFPHS